MNSIEDIWIKKDNIQGLQLPNEVISSDNNVTQNDLHVKLPSLNIMYNDDNV